MPVTVEQLVEIFPNGDEDVFKEVTPGLNIAMAEREITSAQRECMFLAQCAHESMLFSVTQENLNYSADGLKRTFPRYFRDVDASDYHRQPEKIANRVYSNRMGNGDEDSGDGWRYRGRGFIQLTGKNNYAQCGEDLGVDLLGNPDWASTPEGAARTAAWYWWKNDLNKYADADDILTNTKRINGGTIGIAERERFWVAAWEVLSRDEG